MNCSRVLEQLDAWLDGRLDEAAARTISEHLLDCTGCGQERRSREHLRVALASRDHVAVPAELWSEIRSRLGDPGQRAASGAHAGSGSGSTMPRSALRWGFTRRQWGVFAAAAALVFMAGVGTFLMRGEALAAGIDFRPILEQADGDIEAGITALIAAHGGRAISMEDARRLMTVRIHPPAELPAEVRLKGMFLLKMGSKHRSLAFHFSGPRGHVLLLQCPAGVRKDFGNQECLPCKLGAGSDHALRVGALRLMHRDSANMCMCIVSTLAEDADLLAVLDAIPVDY